jgi:hypothetical protein
MFTSSHDCGADKITRDEFNTRIRPLLGCGSCGSSNAGVRAIH